MRSLFLIFLSINPIHFRGEIIVGAFYYPWWRPEYFAYTVAKPILWFLKEREIIIDFRRFPEKFEKIRLIFGKYNTSLPTVAKYHIEKAKMGGIDLFALEWTGPYPTTVPNVTLTEFDILNGFLPALKEFPDFKFCIFYDQTIRMFWKHRIVEEEAYNFENPKVRETFITDITYISQKYFHHPNYFKVDGKPVIWLYLTRLYKGDVEEVFEEIRERLGRNVFIIADELFSTYTINEEKIKIFDAIGCYGTGIDGHSYRDGANSREVIDIAIPYYELWKEKVENITNKQGKKLKFIYPVEAQFDDDHLPGRSPFGEFYCDSPEDFQYYCERVKSIIPSDGGIVFVTSFNEWYETTAIEECFTPSMPFRYNWGDNFLKVLREVFKKEGNACKGSYKVEGSTKTSINGDLYVNKIKRNAETRRSKIKSHLKKIDKFSIFSNSLSRNDPATPEK